MKKLYLLMGISGSGKSTWARDFQSKFSDSIVISRDAVRFSLVKENEAYFAKEKKVFKTFAHLACEAIKAEINNVILDATHLNFSSRQKILNAIKEPLQEHSYKVIVMHIDTKPSNSIARDKKRLGREQVGSGVISKQTDSIEPVTDSEKRFWKEFFNIEYWSITL